MRASAKEMIIIVVDAISRHARGAIWRARHALPLRLYADLEAAVDMPCIMALLRREI